MEGRGSGKVKVKSVHSGSTFLGFCTAFLYAGIKLAVEFSFSFLTILPRCLRIKVP